MDNQGLDDCMRFYCIFSLQKRTRLDCWLVEKSESLRYRPVFLLLLPVSVVFPVLLCFLFCCISCFCCNSCSVLFPVPLCCLYFLFLLYFLLSLPPLIAAHSCCCCCFFYSSSGTRLTSFAGATGCPKFFLPRWKSWIASSSTSFMMTARR